MSQTTHLPFIIYVSKHRYYCVLEDIAESSVVTWCGKEFRPLQGFAGFYEYLRSIEHGGIVGVELHLASPVYDDILQCLPHFVIVDAPPTFPHRWQFRLADGPAKIDWEQILTENPFLGTDGDVLLILKTDHLTDEEYSQVRHFTTMER